MAQIAVGVVAAVNPATSIIGALAYAAAGVAAAYVDQRLIYPAIFGENDIPEQTLQQQLTRSREGSPIPILFGPKNRVPGSVAWIGPIDEEQSAVSAGGGKGGGSQTVWVKNYIQDGLVVFAKGPIYGWQKVYANGEVLWDYDLQTLVIGGPNFRWPSGAQGFGFVYQIFSASGGLIYAWTLSTSDKNDVAGFVPGTKFVFESGISGGTFRPRLTGPVTAIDWTQEFEVVRMTERFGGADIDFYSGDFTNATHGGFLGPIITVPLVVSSQLQLRVTTAVATSKIERFDFTYGGGIDDQSSPLRNQAWAPMVADEGVDAVPDYAATAWCGFFRLNRNEFFNTFPVSLEAEVKGQPGTGGTYLYRDAIARIFESEAGLPSTAVDVTAVEGGDLRGFTIQGKQTAIQAVQPLLGAFDILTQQDGESTKFISRKNVEIIDIPEEHIDSFEVGGIDELTKAARKSTWKLASTLQVEFFDVDRDLETGTVKVVWSLDEQKDIESPILIRFPIALNKTEARTIGWRLLRAARNQSQRLFVSVPPCYDYIAESDAIRFPFAGRTRTVLVQRVDRSERSGLIRIEGIEDDPTAPDIVPEPYTPVRRLGVDSSSIRLPVPLASAVHSLPPLRDGDHLTGGVYAGFYNADPRSRFRGAIIYESPDVDPRSYTQKATRENRDICGITQTALPTATAGMLGVWDLSSTVDVVLFGGELESRGLDLTAHGYEYAVVGDEVIRFAQADLIDENTYRLSKLIRGLRDTGDVAMSTHEVNESFLLFSKLSGVFIPERSPRARRHWKVVSPGGDITRAMERTIENQTGTLRPFSVGHLAATGSAGSNIEVSWSPRTNRIKPLFVSVEDELASWVYEVKVEHATIEQEPFLDVQVTGTSYSLTTSIQGGAEIDPGTPLLISVRRFGKFANSKWQSVQV